MSVKRIIALILVYGLCCCAWMILAGVTESRTGEQSWDMRSQVGSLWGAPQVQTAPQLSFREVKPSSRAVPASEVIAESEAELLQLQFPEPKELSAEEKKLDAAARKKMSREELEAERRLWVERMAGTAVSLESSKIKAKLHSDPRRKGLVWFALYDVNYGADYVYKHTEDTSGYLDINFSLPAESAVYDDLVFRVQEQDMRAALDPESGKFSVSIPVTPGSEVPLRVAYKSRGSADWKYVPGARVQQLDNFHLTLSTDFANIDFPNDTVSPTEKLKEGKGWDLVWDFQSTVTGHGMGVVLPERMQPGELSTALIFSAPVSLLFYFVMLIVLALLQDLDIHPVNYLFIGSAFFAFHLLFSYSADYLSVPWAFGISSAVSVFLVISYLRLVISPRFALREAALGQLVYLVGFSLAHFWEGFTGLTITVLAIVTLFFLMQATGRMKWTEVFRANHSQKSSSRAAAPSSGLDKAASAQS